MMTLMAIILFAGLLPKIGKFVPSSSIAGFLFVLGAIVTIPGNAAASFSSGDPASGLIGGITMVVKAITDPFLGMLAGLVIKVLIGLFGF